MLFGCYAHENKIKQNRMNIIIETNARRLGTNRNLIDVPLKE